MDDLTAADYRLLLSLLKFAIVAPEQRERVQSALEAGKARADGQSDRRKIEAEIRAWAKGRLPNVKRKPVSDLSPWADC